MGLAGNVRERSASYVIEAIDAHSSTRQNRFHGGPMSETLQPRICQNAHRLAPGVKARPNTDGVFVRGASLVVLAMLFGSGCYVRDIRWVPIRPPPGVAYREYALETTGYCPCGRCCGWQRNWFGRPVVAGGPRRGEPKQVGYTASGTRALPGTLAADTALFPFGTIMAVPGYGYGRVEDRGRRVKGYRIDLYFRSHGQACAWGRVTKKVKVWPAPAPPGSFLP